MRHNSTNKMRGEVGTEAVFPLLLRIEMADLLTLEEIHNNISDGGSAGYCLAACVGQSSGHSFR